MYIFEKSVTEARKNLCKKAFENLLKAGDVLLVFAGDTIQKPGGLDQNYSFICHPDYYWLTGLQRAGGVVAYSKDEGWVEFVKATSKEELVWEGLSATFDARDFSDFEAWMGRKKFQRIVVLGQSNPKQRELENSDSNFREEVQEALNKIRRVKDSAEIDLVKKTFQTALVGYNHLKTFIRAGITERDVQLEYEHAVLKAGAEKFPYDTLVGAGTNAAILHAVPSAKLLQKGEMLVVDAGADIHDYCVDITRAYAVSGTFDQRQSSIYNLVLKSQQAAIAKCLPGVEWSEIHISTARILAEGLKDLGVFKSTVDAILESGAISVFFPHGVGHMVGLRVRDVGGRAHPNPKHYCGVRIRVDLPLEENFLMTVEPGLYFISGLMNDPEVRNKYKDHIHWAEADKWQDFGGVRIEDNILIKSGGPENLTEAVEK